MSVIVVLLKLIYNFLVNKLSKLMKKMGLKLTGRISALSPIKDNPSWKKIKSHNCILQLLNNYYFKLKLLVDYSQWFLS